MTVTANIHVLMSTFNGQAYLERQIDRSCTRRLASELFVRDDGSTDDTPICSRRWLRLDTSNGSVAQFGVTGSFFRLLRECRATPTTWPSRIKTTCGCRPSSGAPSHAQRHHPHAPALYCSRATITDERLKPIGLTPLWPRQPAFGNALVENIVSGCTIVLNRPAQDLLLSAPSPKRAIFHDWWCYLVISGAWLGGLRPGAVHAVSPAPAQHRRRPERPPALRRAVRRIVRRIVQDGLGSDPCPGRGVFTPLPIAYFSRHRRNLVDAVGGKEIAL